MAAVTICSESWPSHSGTKWNSAGVWPCSLLWKSARPPWRRAWLQNRQPSCRHFVSVEPLPSGHLRAGMLSERNIIIIHIVPPGLLQWAPLDSSFLYFLSFLPFFLPSFFLSFNFSNSLDTTSQLLLVARENATLKCWVKSTQYCLLPHQHPINLHGNQSWTHWCPSQA